MLQLGKHGFKIPHAGTANSAELIAAGGRSCFLPLRFSLLAALLRRAERTVVLPLLPAVRSSRSQHAEEEEVAPTHQPAHELPYKLPLYQRGHLLTLQRHLPNSRLNNRAPLPHILLRNVERRDEPDRLVHARREGEDVLLEALCLDARGDVGRDLLAGRSGGVRVGRIVELDSDHLSQSSATPPRKAREMDVRVPVLGPQR